MYICTFRGLNNAPDQLIPLDLDRPIAPPPQNRWTEKKLKTIPEHFEIYIWTPDNSISVSDFHKYRDSYEKWIEIDPENFKTGPDIIPLYEHVGEHVGDKNGESEKSSDSGEETAGENNRDPAYTEPFSYSRLIYHIIRLFCKNESIKNTIPLKTVVWDFLPGIYIMENLLNNQKTAGVYVRGDLPARYIETVERLLYNPGGTHRFEPRRIPKKSRIVKIMENLLDFNPDLPTHFPVILQSYFLDVGESEINIISPTEVGLYYGLLTLARLIYTEGNVRLIQQQTIFDYPDFEIRGITDQQCHGQVATVDSLKEEIIALSDYKQNMLGMNLEDIMPFKQWPELGKGRGAFSEKEIDEIVSFARLYYVEIMPGFQGLGHLESLLYHPEFRNIAEFPGSGCLNISDPASWETLKQWYYEIHRVFHPHFINICMDETYDLGKFKSRNWVEENGGTGKVLIDHINRLFDFIHNELKCEVFIYHDSIVKWAGNLLGGIPRDLKIIYWNYTPKHRYRAVKKFSSQGFFTVVSPSIINWSRPFPFMRLAIKNIIQMARNGKKYGARGFINSSWGDFGNENLRGLNIFGFTWGFAASWNVDALRHETGRDNYMIAFYRDYFGMFNGHLMHDFLIYLDRINKKGLRGPWNTPFFERFYAHPLIFRKKRGLSIYFKAILRNGFIQIGTEMLEAINKSAVKNRDKLRVFVYVLEIIRISTFKRILDYLIERSLMRDRRHIQGHLGKALGKFATIGRSGDEFPETTENIGLDEYIKEFIGQLKDLSQLYSSLWLSNAKYEGLERILRKYNMLEDAYKEVIDIIRADKKGKRHGKREIPNVYLDSEWITDARYSNWKELPPRDSRGPKALIFKKTFYIPLEKGTDRVDYARIQAIANTYLIIRLNGKRIGDVITRHFLSPVIFDNAVKIFDIKPYLKAGENELIIESWEYTGTINSINIFGEIAFTEGNNETITIRSDRSWESSWNGGFKGCKVLGPPPALNGPILRPNLKDGKKSFYYFSIGLYEALISSLNMELESERVVEIINKLARKIFVKRPHWIFII